MGAVILFSDKKARLKPCLRCGYSLLHISGAKNCPECGLAVRISLSGNSGLEWTNPRWQRFRALGFGVLAFGMFCRVVSAGADWASYWTDEDQFSAVAFRFLEWIDKYSGEADPIICGLALCLLARGERRHPDRSRPVRAIALGAGLLLIAVGLLNALVQHGLWQLPPFWNRDLLSDALGGPWIPLIVSILACTYALHFAKRSGSRILRRLSRVPLWPAAAGLVVWLLKIDQLFSPLASFLWEATFPASMIVMLIAAIRVLLLGAREADLNWVTDR